MAVISCIEQIGLVPRNGDEDKEGYILNRVFYVEVDDLADDSVTAKAGSFSFGLPVPYDVHPNQDDTELVSYNVEELGSMLFKITCNYEPKNFETSEMPKPDGGGTNDPMEQAVSVSWGATIVEIFCGEKDKNNKAVVNAAGQQFIDPPKRKVVRKTCSIKFNSKSFTPVVIDNYCGTTNSAAVTFTHNGVGLAIAARRGMITGINTNRKFKAGYGFYDEVTLQFEFLHSSEDPHIPTQIANIGMLKKTADGLEKITVGTPPKNNPINSPVPLKADGSDIIGPADALNFIDFEFETEINWNGLPAILGF